MHNSLSTRSSLYSTWKYKYGIQHTSAHPIGSLPESCTLFAMTEYLKNVALVGASGNLGSKVLPALIQQGQHNITVISRVESNATFPEGVLVKKGTYDDNGFLESSFAGQDIVIFMLGFAAMKDEDNMIHAAAKAGVKYVIPSEFGSPSEDPAFVEAVPMLAGNLARHDLIRSLGLKYIVVSTNAWLDYVSTPRSGVGDGRY